MYSVVILAGSPQRVDDHSLIYGCGSPIFRTILGTCLSIRRICRVAGWWQTRLDVLSDQVLRGLVWPSVAGRRWRLAAGKATSLPNAPIGIKPSDEAPCDIGTAC